MKEIPGGQGEKVQYATAIDRSQIYFFYMTNNLANGIHLS